jgi:hypothetical protein
MTRTTVTKFAATALAIASLGVAGAAPALAAEYEMPADEAVPAQVEQAPQDQVDEEKTAETPEQSIAIGEPPPGTVPEGTEVTPVDPQTGEPIDPETAPEQEEEVDYNSPEYYESDEAKDRYERYCNMQDAEPSHSDKQFCEDYDNYHHDGSTTDGSEGTDHWTPDSEEGDHWKEPGYEPTYEHKPYKPAKHVVKHSSGGSLPFTGLEVWQLGLLAMALIGGGLAARRLLVR